MPISKELIKDLRVMIASQETFHHDVAQMSFEHAKALLDEIERLQGENEKLKQTSVEVERPDGSKAYVQMHCTHDHDHFIEPGIGLKML